MAKKQKPTNLYPKELEALISIQMPFTEADLLPYDPNADIPKEQWELELEQMEAAHEKEREAFFKANPQATEMDFFQHNANKDTNPSGWDWCGFGK